LRPITRYRPVAVLLGVCTGLPLVIAIHQVFGSRTSTCLVSGTRLTGCTSSKPALIETDLLVGGVILGIVLGFAWWRSAISTNSKSQ
jgi:MFS superfamily sulfate permease-like transporter